MNGHPYAYVPLAGLIAILVIAVARPSGAIGRGIAIAPAWPAALIALTVASLVAFIANDTGVSAAAPGFLYAMAALCYPVFLVAARR